MVVGSVETHRDAADLKIGGAHTSPRAPSARGRLLTRVVGSVLARFASVGIVNTLVDLLAYVVMVGVSPLIANFASTSAGMTVSFIGNRRFVFGRTAHRAREITLFMLVCGVGIWVIQPAVIHGVRTVLAGAVLAEDMLGETLAKVVAIGVAAVWNYALYKTVVFRGALRPSRGAGAA